MYIDSSCSLGLRTIVCSHDWGLAVYQGQAYYSSNYSTHADPLLLEMTVESLEHRLVSVEHNQKMILKRLTAIEQAIKLTPPEPLQSNWTQDMNSDGFEQYEEFESYDQCLQYKTTQPVPTAQSRY